MLDEFEQNLLEELEDGIVPSYFPIENEIDSGDDYVF